MKGMTRGLLSAVIIGSVVSTYAAETVKKEKRQNSH